MKWRKECIKYRAHFRYKIKKSLLPEKYYLLGFLLVGFFTALFIGSFIRLISSNLSTYPTNLHWGHFLRIFISPFLLLFLLLHGIYVKHKGEKAVSFLWALIYAIGTFAKFIRDKGIYNCFEAALYCVAIACGLTFLFMIIEKKIRTVKITRNQNPK
jgi:hypothetical protein